MELPLPEMGKVYMEIVWINKEQGFSHKSVL